MESQTNEREELYLERAAYGAAFPANGVPYAIGNNQPIESKLRAAVSLLSYGRCVCVEATWFQGVVCCKACDSNCQLLPPKVILLVCVTR